MSIASRLRLWTRPTPPRRLRAMYWAVSACALALLGMLHVSLAAEHRLEVELSAATRAELAAPHVLIVRVASPVARATKVQHNTRAATAHHKEKSHGRR